MVSTVFIFSKPFYITWQVDDVSCIGNTNVSDHFDSHNAASLLEECPTDDKVQKTSVYDDVGVKVSN